MLRAAPGSPGARCGLESSGRRCVQQPQSVTCGLGVCRPQAHLHPLAPRAHSVCRSAGGWGRVCRERDRWSGIGGPLGSRRCWSAGGWNCGLPRAGQTSGDREACVRGQAAEAPRRSLAE